MKHLLSAISATLALSIAPISHADSLETVIDQHLGAYERLDPDEVTDSVRANLSGTNSVFHPDAQLGPLARAVLIVEATEAPQPHSRLRIRLHDQHDSPDGPVWLVEAARFNLGPVRRADLVSSLGEDVVAPADEFGVAPDVDYRFVMRPMRGTAAMLEGVARSDINIQNETCLGSPCAVLTSVAEAVSDWSDPEQRTSLSFNPPYAIKTSEHLSAAAALDLMLEELGLTPNEGGQLSWTGIEPRSGQGDEPYLEVVIETGLGQDVGLEATAMQFGVMDHAIKTMRVRVQSPSSQNEPQIFLSRSHEAR